MKFRIIAIIYTCIPFIMNGQECSNQYIFDPQEDEGYTMACGEITENSIKVSRNSCNFYTPLTIVGDSISVDSAEIILSAVFTANENIDENDFVWIFSYIDGKSFRSKTIYGNSLKSSYEYTDNFKVPSGSNFRFRIAFTCDESNEYWELQKGNLSICIKDQFTPIEHPIKQTENTVTAIKERGFVKLKWVTKASLSANYFKIERSTDGKQFRFTGFVKENNSTGSTEYSFIDSRPEKPKTWYRIKQVNEAGEEKIIGEPVVISY